MCASNSKAAVGGSLAPVSADEPHDLGSALRRLALIGVALMAMQAAHAQTDRAWKIHQAQSHRTVGVPVPPR